MDGARAYLSVGPYQMLNCWRRRVKSAVPNLACFSDCIVSTGQPKVFGRVVLKGAARQRRSRVVPQRLTLPTS